MMAACVAAHVGRNVKMMMKNIDVYQPLSEDIIRFINVNFNDRRASYVVNLYSVYFANRIDNNCHENVIRASLFLAKGNLDLLKANLSHGDYRDILIVAEEESGNFGHYFRMTFEDIDELVQEIGKDNIQQINEYDDLPVKFYIHDQYGN